MIRPSTCAIGVLFCRVVTILDDFASVSGLVTSRAKSIIVALDPRGRHYLRSHVVLLC